jgi:hypothetical protein
MREQSRGNTVVLTNGSVVHNELLSSLFIPVEEIV